MREIAVRRTRYLSSLTSHLLAFLRAALSGTKSCEMCVNPPGGCSRVVLQVTVSQVS